MIKKLITDIKSYFISRFTPLLPDLQICFREFAVLYKAGIPLSQAMRILSVQALNPVLKSAFAGCYQKILSGYKLSSAMSGYEAVFPHLYITMIELGEKSGNIVRILEQIAQHIEKRRSLDMSLKAALTYPVFVFVLALIMLFLAPTFIFKNLFAVFMQMGASLPLITKILISITSVISSPFFFIAVIVLCIAGNLAMRILWKRRLFRRTVQSALLSIPGVGYALHCAEVITFARTMSTTCNSGITLLAGLELALKSSTSLVLQEKLAVVKERIMEGWTLRRALNETLFFPPSLLGLVEVGEETGELGKMYECSAWMCEQDLQLALDAVVSVIQPLAMLIIGAIVGFVVFAMMTPMMKLVETI
ncbi:MAG: type II secretion system F family protein [Vulcanimicrobiota bacterium]